MGSDMYCMERKELRHDRHTVSLLTAHKAITPKYREKILVGDVALAVEGIIRTTCKEMKIETVDMAVNVDHVHLFLRYPLKRLSHNSKSQQKEGRIGRYIKKQASDFAKYLIMGRSLKSGV